jgi:perosamine synthetase
VAANVCEIVVAAILQAGCRPVFHDVHPKLGNVELDHLQCIDTKDISLWIAVHNYGVPLAMPVLLPWARERGLLVVEDACNAMGAEYMGTLVGDFGDAAVHSFGYAKIISVGQGGALRIRDPQHRQAITERLRSFPEGSVAFREVDQAYQHVIQTVRQHPNVGTPGLYRQLYDDYLQQNTYRPDETLIQTILTACSRLPETLACRRQRAERYRQELSVAGIEHPPAVEGAVYWRYNVLFEQRMRDRMLAALRAVGLPASRWYPPVHAQFAQVVETSAFPGATEFSRRVLNLSTDESITEEDVTRCIRVIRDELKKT